MPAEHELALHEVRVDVAAEDRRREQQGGAPDREDGPQPTYVAHVTGEHVRTQDQPRLEEERAEDDAGAGHEGADVGGLQGVDQRDVAQGALGGDPADAQRTDRDDECADQARDGVAQREREPRLVVDEVGPVGGVHGHQGYRRPGARRQRERVGAA